MTRPLPISIESALTDVERALAQVGEAMKTSDATELQRASDQLKNTAVHFSSFLSAASASALSPAVVVRVRSVAARLAGQRDALARMSAVVDRQVATLLPKKSASATYGISHPGARGAAGRYGTGH